MASDAFADTRAVISGLGPICPEALGVDALASPEYRNVDPGGDGDDDSWFDTTRFVGPRGTKYLTPATRYLLGSARLALDDAGLAEGHYDAEEKGVMIGTNFAVSRVHAQMDAVVLGEGSQSLSPMEAANFSINLAASHVSIKHGLKAFNVSLTSPVVAGLEALILAAHAIRNGRARLVLAGATEDRPPEEVADLLGGPPSTGAACTVVLEQRSRAAGRNARVYAEFVPVMLRFVAPGSLASASGRNLLAGVVQQALDGCLASEHTTLHWSSAPDRSGAFHGAVTAAVLQALTERRIRVVHETLVGGSGSFATASPVLQLCELAFRRRSAMVLATSPQGHIALVMLQALHNPEPRPADA